MKKIGRVIALHLGGLLGLVNFLQIDIWKDESFLRSIAWLLIVGEC